MAARISGLALIAALAVPVSLAQVSTAPSASAQVFVTGYTLQGYTATGTYVHPGTCAVDPRVIPLGSYVTIQGLGTCHAEDTGGAIIGYRIDVWVPTMAQAYALTGWYTASWGPSPPRQVRGPPAAQPQSPAPIPQRLPQRLARAGGAALQRAYAIRPYWYSHGNPFVHSDPPAPARHGVAQPTYALISFPTQGCPAVRWTTIVARVRACTLAAVPALHDIQEGMGQYWGALGTHVAGPHARAQEHEAGVRSAEQAHLERRVASPRRERGVLWGARGGSAGTSVQSVLTTGTAVSFVWVLAITMLAGVAAWTQNATRAR